MSTQELIVLEVNSLPESLQQEVLHFASFLRAKREETFHGLRLSEEVLRRDWDTPEEDAAWRNL